MFKRFREGAATKAQIVLQKEKRGANLTSFTSGSWLSIHAISMQRVFIKFCKSSKSWAAVANNARQPGSQARQTDRPCDSAHWQRHQLRLPQSGQCGFVYVSSGYRGPRVSQRDVIGVGTGADQSAGELSQAPIFLASMFVLWYVFYVASHMDISRDVSGGQTLLCFSSDTFVVCRGLKLHLFGAGIDLGAVILLYLSLNAPDLGCSWWLYS